MKAAASFAAGFATGWVVRSTVDSSREAVVKLVALCYDALERARRMLALERERLDDLAAEARARVRVGGEAEPNPIPTSAPEPAAHASHDDGVGFTAPAPPREQTA